MCCFSAAFRLLVLCCAALCRAIAACLCSLPHVHALYRMQAYEKAEDPIHVLENNIPIDPQYYLENQLSKVKGREGREGEREEEKGSTSQRE